MPTGEKCTFITDHHDGSWFNGRIHANVEVLGAVSVREPNIARNFDITFEEASHSATLAVNSRTVAFGNPNNATAVALVFTPNTRATGCALGFAVDPHP